MRDLLKEKTATSTRLVELKGYKEQYNNKKSIYEANIKDAEQKIKEIQEKLLYNNTKEVLTEHSKIIDKFDFGRKISGEEKASLIIAMINKSDFNKKRTKFLDRATTPRTPKTPFKS